MLPTAQTIVELRTTYTDRAKGFQLATLPISIAFGVGVLVVAIVGYSVPVMSIAALATFWLAFLAWWLVGWGIHNVASPDGVALLQALLMYKYVRNEQRERIRRYGLNRGSNL
jgi:ABC-type antimicrobial peptide transport system permease subunit